MNGFKKSHMRIFLSLSTLVVICTIMTSALIARKNSEQGYLGVTIERLSSEDKEDFGVNHGVLVVEVSEDGPAEKAGIEENDIIQYVDGKIIRRPDDLVRVVRKTKPKSQIKLVYTRETERKEVTVTIGSYDSYAWNKEDVFFSFGDRAYLGVKLQELNKELAEYFHVKPEEGALILEIEEESPAEISGLKAGDVIVEFDEDKIACPKDIQNILKDLEEGDKIEVVIVRHEKKQKINVELAEKTGPQIKLFGKFPKNKSKSFDLNIQVPEIEKIKLPDIQCDIKCENLEECLEDLGEKLEKHGKEIEKTVKEFGACSVI